MEVKNPPGMNNTKGVYLLIDVLPFRSKNSTRSKKSNKSNTSTRRSKNRKTKERSRTNSGSHSRNASRTSKKHRDRDRSNSSEDSEDFFTGESDEEFVSVSSNSDKAPRVSWTCEHCTYVNNPGVKVMTFI